VRGGSAEWFRLFRPLRQSRRKKQELQSFVVYDRYPGLVLVVSPRTPAKSRRSRSAGKKVGRQRPGSSTDFFSNIC